MKRKLPIALLLLTLLLAGFIPAGIAQADTTGRYNYYLPYHLTPLQQIDIYWTTGTWPEGYDFYTGQFIQHNSPPRTER